MKILLSRMVKLLFVAFSFVLQVANAFLGNIIVYETTEKFRFDWLALLKNKIFWGIFTVNLIYFFLSFIINRVVILNDKKLEEAISKSSVDLINHATEQALKGEYESSKKVLKVLDQIRKRGVR